MSVEDYQDRTYRAQAFSDVETFVTYLSDFAMINIDNRFNRISMHMRRRIDHYAMMYWGKATEAYLKRRYDDACAQAKRAAAFFVWSLALDSADHWPHRDVSYAYLSIISGIVPQVQHHFNKYGAQRVSVLDWLAIITEEWGETAEEVVECRWDDAVTEGQQTLACISRFITELRRDEDGTSDREDERYTYAV
jgi:hypothetical protein